MADVPPGEHADNVVRARAMMAAAATALVLEIFMMNVSPRRD
jgi:hypothetical protein